MGRYVEPTQSKSYHHVSRRNHELSISLALRSLPISIHFSNRQWTWLNAWNVKLVTASAAWAGWPCHGPSIDNWMQNAKGKWRWNRHVHLCTRETHQQECHTYRSHLNRTPSDKNNSQIILNCWPLDELDKIYESPGLLLVDIHASTLRCGGLGLQWIYTSSEIKWWSKNPTHPASIATDSACGVPSRAIHILAKATSQSILQNHDHNNNSKNKNKNTNNNNSNWCDNETMWRWQPLPEQEAHKKRQ